MATGRIFTKIGTLKVKNGTYKKDGVAKNRYQEVGVLMSSPHGSSLFIKMHATATSEPRIVSVFMDDEVKFSVEKEAKEEISTDIPNDAPSYDEIPFRSDQ